MKEVIQNLLKNRLEELLKDRVIETLPIEIRVDHSKDKTQGDFATNIAMVLSKQAKSSPRDLAAKIIEGMAQSDAVKKIEIAGPGFINFFLSADANFKIIEEILEAGSHFGLSKFGADTRILLEFVSANPTGPLHVGHGRGAAYGATVANLLRSQGYSVDCEYYVNDAGRQMDILAVSVYLRYINSAIFPVNGYQGSYILDIAKQIKDLPEVNIFKNVSPDETEGGDKEKHIDDLISNCKELLGNEYLRLHDFACNQILQDIRKDLEEFHVVFEKWFSEKSLETNQLAPKIIDKLKQSDDIYEKNGALWFNTEKYGDEKDRVVVRENGLHTYFASDIAYHYEKYSRGYDEIINIWGADHHGYIPRVKASISSLGLNPEKLKVLLVQFANLYRDGKQVQMSTRSGSFVTLRELREEVGNDAARFFYVLRKSEQHMDFDLDLAKSKTNDNPVFYIQYAHARICSVQKQSNSQFGEIDLNCDLSVLTHEHEDKLIKELNRYQEILKNSARDYEPHVLAYYLKDLAGNFHSYYNSCEFITEDVHIRNARLTLISAVKQIIFNGLSILGVSAPESM